MDTDKLMVPIVLLIILIVTGAASLLVETLGKVFGFLAVLLGTLIFLYLTLPLFENR